MFFPVWTNVDPQSGNEHHIYPIYYKYFSGFDQETQITYFPYTAIGILALLAAGIAVYEIFKYKDRLTQMKLGALNSVVMAAVLGCSVWFVTDGQKEWEVAGTYGIGFFLPPAAMIFNILANRFIRKDEKLVRSVDRIR